MEDKENLTKNWPKKSHEALLKILNNVGIIGAILAALLDLIFVMIMVFGLKVDADFNSILIFAVVNALIGLMINFLLRYQGKKYAEIENKELCDKFYRREIKVKKHLPIEAWMALKVLQDIVIKGITTGFSIFGVIYISIEGSKNPIQILLTLATLVLFACFGLMAMNSAYCRFYNIQIPLMELRLNEGYDQKTKKSVRVPKNYASKKNIAVDMPNNGTDTAADHVACCSTISPGILDDIDDSDHDDTVIILDVIGVQIDEEAQN